MNPTTRLMLTACAGLALAACSPRPHLTVQQVQSVKGLDMDQVKAKLGGPHVVTDAGDSVWWDYDDITTAEGKSTGSCQVIFKKGVADQVKC